MNIWISRSILFAGLSIIAACQNIGPAKEIKLSTTTKPQVLMVAIAKNAQKCWFNTRTTSFSKYKLASEVNSYAGMPRVLLVPKSNPTGLPALVIQASANNQKTQLQAFGPFLSGNSGQLVSKDLKNWIKGSKSCTP